MSTRHQSQPGTAVNNERVVTMSGYVIISIQKYVHWTHSRSQCRLILKSHISQLAIKRLKPTHRINKDTDWIGLCSVLRPRQHSIGYMGDGFYRSKDPTNSIKVLKENLQKKITQRTKKTQNTHAYTQNRKTNTAYNYNTASPLVYNNMG